MRMSSTEKSTAFRRLLPAMMTLLGIFMFSGLMQAQSLLIDVSVNNTAPGPNDIVTYKVRYRCASITSHCFNSHITFTLPDAFDITNSPGVGGNVASVSMVGNAIDVYLVSPPSAGAPAGALAAGASGILETKVKFKCGTNGVAPMPPAGTTVNFTALPTFTVTGGSQTAVAPSPVTVPTVSSCPSAPPNPPATNISKRVGANGNPVLIQPGAGNYFFIGVPAIASGTWTVTDDIPEGIYMKSLGSPSGGTCGILNMENLEVQIGGVWYSIFNFTGGYCGDKLISWLDAHPTVGQQINAYDALNGNLIPVPGCFRDAQPTVTCIDKVRWTFGPGAGGTMFNDFFVSPDAVPGPRINCLTTDNPDWTTVCANPVYVTEKPLFNPEATGLYSENYFYLGTSSLTSAVAGQNWYALSGNPNLYKDPLDGIAFMSLTSGKLYDGGIVYETLLPEGFEYSTDPTRPNFWFEQVQNFPSCSGPTFTAIPNYSGTQTLLRWEYPTCDVIQSRLYFSFRYTATTPLPANLCFPAGTIRLYNGEQLALGAPPACVASIPVPERCLPKPASGGDVNSIKWVKGALDASFSRYPLTGNTNLTGNGTYEIFVSSADWQNVKQIDVADILPYVGDQGMLTAGARGSAWSEELAAAITVERYKIGTGLVNASANLPFGVMYTTAANPCYLDAAQPAGQVKADVALANFGMAGGCTDFNGATPALAAKGFLFRWSNSADPLIFGEYLKLTIPVRQLTGEADNLTGGISWNSVAFTATEIDDDELLSSEPLKVGLKMVDQSTTAAIGDYVWLDGNANGRQDAGETPLSGVVVSLYNAAGQPVTQPVIIGGVPTTIPVTTITDANGYYCFPGLTPNTNYYVRLESVTNFGTGGNLSTYTLTTPNAVADDIDSDATLGTLAGSPVTPRPQILAPTGAGGTQTKTYDFGFVCLGSLSGYAWMDTDNEGDQDNGEMGLSGIVVTLRNATTNAAVGSTTVTNSSGNFTLSSVSPGYYYIEFTNFPVGKVPTYKDLTGNDNNDSDVNPNGRTDAFILGPCDVLVFDLGLRTPPANPASICGKAWDDLDKDGTIDAGEPGVGNVTVKLLDNAGFVLSTVTTDGNGQYCFTNLDPNVTYQVSFVPPHISIMFGPAGPDQDVNPATGVTILTYTPTPNQNITGVDAGFMGPLSIGNLVWNDLNSNGLYTSNEPTFSGITVRLIASDGTTVLGTTTTDDNGRYIFKYLMAGTYFVEAGVPAGGYRSSTDAVSTPTPNSVDNDDNGVGIGSTGFIRSNAIVLVNTGGTAGDANWSESDAAQPIMGCIDPAINRKAYYTVDFGFNLIPPCTVLPCGKITVTKN
jgi:protocatechuate 3,4-dioxygenase beta subunit